MYFKHRLEISKNITISSFKVRPLQWFWCLFGIHVLQEFFHWHLYLCISSFLCNCIWVSDVMYVCVYLQISHGAWELALQCVGRHDVKGNPRWSWDERVRDMRNGMESFRNTVYICHLPMIVQNIFACPYYQSPQGAQIFWVCSDFWVFESLHRRHLSAIWLIWENRSN